MNKEDEFQKTEYEQICQYFINVSNYRFLLFGFYSASIGLIISAGEINLAKSFLIFILTISIHFMEMRNRSLLKSLKDRGIKIEDSLLNSRKKSLHFFNYLDRKREEMGGRIFGFKFKNVPLLIEVISNKKDKYIYFPKRADLKEANYVYYLFSFSFAVDFAYSFALLFSILSIYKQLIK